MTDDAHNILEHLRHIRGRVDAIASDTGDLKARMSSLETAMVGVRRDVNHGDETDARQQLSLDRLAAPIERIERRLDLVEPR